MSPLVGLFNITSCISLSTLNISKIAIRPLVPEGHSDDGTVWYISPLTPISFLNSLGKYFIWLSICILILSSIGTSFLEDGHVIRARRWAIDNMRVGAIKYGSTP